MHYNVIVTAEIKQLLANPASFDMPQGVKNLLSDLLASKVKVVSEGTLRSSKDGRITLTFNSANGHENTISFSKAEPNLIALCRGEKLFQDAVTIFLEEGKRHRCISSGKDGEHVEFTVRTSKVDNRLLKSGKLNLEYSIDVCGVRAESSQMNITVVHDTSEK